MKEHEQFPLTLAAIKKGELSQWDIGDALIKECGPPSLNGIQDGSYEHLTKAAKYLLNKGYEYSVTALSQFRITSFAFSLSQREASISWAAHKAARTSEFLQSVIAGVPKGTKITVRYIDELRQAQRARVQREFEAQQEKAIAEIQAAEAAEAEAQVRLQAAAVEEKEAMRAELIKAAKKAEKARSKRQKSPPPKKLGPVEPEEQPQLLSELRFGSKAAQALVLAKEAIEEIRSCVDDLSEVMVDGLTHEALEAANSWTEAANFVRSKSINQRGHLSVVGE